MRLIGTADSRNWGKPLSTLANLGIDYLIPRTPAIAAASCAVGWYSYRYLMTYSQQILADTVTQQFQKILGETIGGYTGHFFAPLIVPEASPYLAAEASIGMSLATSLMLNIVARLFFGIKKQSGGEAYLKKIAEKSIQPNSTTVPASKEILPPATLLEAKKEDKPTSATQSIAQRFFSAILNPCDCCCYPTQDTWHPNGNRMSMSGTQTGFAG